MEGKSVGENYIFMRGDEFANESANISSYRQRLFTSPVDSDQFSRLRSGEIGGSGGTGKSPVLRRQFIAEREIAQGVPNPKGKETTIQQ